MNSKEEKSMVKKNRWERADDAHKESSITTKKLEGETSKNKASDLMPCNMASDNDNTMKRARTRENFQLTLSPEEAHGADGRCVPSL